MFCILTITSWRYTEKYALSKVEKTHNIVVQRISCFLSMFHPSRTRARSHDGVYTDGSEMNERVGAAVVINRHFLNGETNCRQLSKRQPDNNTIFAAEATAITLALNYNWHMGPVHHDVVVYSESISCLPYHASALVIEWHGHVCSFLMDNKPLWHWGKWKNGPTSKRYPWPRHRPTDKRPLYRYEATGQLLHTAVVSNQVGCNCTWQRYISHETNTGVTAEPPALNQSWRVYNHPTSTWPYQGHRVPYIFLRTAKCLSPLWSNTDNWPYAPGCTVVQECHDEYYTADALNTLYETIPDTCIVEL